MMKVGLLGGSFNPAHYGHLHISNIAIKRLALNQVWWIPTLQNPFKERSSTSYEKRVLACEVLAKNNPKIYVKKYSEIYTIDLVSRLRRKFKTYDFFWIAGADNLENLHRWRGFRKLAKIVPFVIVPRETSLLRLRKAKVCRQRGLKFLFVKAKSMNVSSTEIRNNSNV